jgi:ferrochelatase
VINEKKPEKIIFSFHGIPERHVKKTDLTNSHCLETPQCCDQITEANKNCYRAQCFATARKLAEQLHLNPDQFHVSFQSRLGRTPWIKPYTDLLFTELAKSGVKRIAVVCPSFVADCLETLEEVAIRGRDDFIKAGGEELYFIPSLNSHPKWIEAISNMIENRSS